LRANGMLGDGTKGKTQRSGGGAVAGG